MFITAIKAIDNKEHLTKAISEVVGESAQAISENDVREAFDDALDFVMQRYFHGNTIWKARNFGR